MVGAALIPRLLARGHKVLRLVRGRAGRDPSEIAWDPAAGTIDRERLRGADAVINLAGANLAHWPWTASYKREMWNSRVQSNALLASALAESCGKVTVFHSASAVGYYGNRDGEVLSENSSPGTGFLADLCKAWENAMEPARRAGVRVVQTRFGVILTGAGGALPTMALPFRFGLGGRLGSGRQYLSWVSFEDAVESVTMAIERNDFEGPVNVVSPQSVTNAQFAKTLAHVLRRPSILPAPAFVLRAILGEMGSETLLSGQRVEPAVLLDRGYVFRHPSLEVVLRLVFKAEKPT